MDQFAFRRLISGQDKSLGAFALRLFLYAVSLLYGTVIKLRNHAFDTGLIKSAKAQVPVISIGNITTGGTGKTPLVIWLCNKISQMNLRTAVLTRGYMSEEGTMGDEPTMLAKSCPQTKVIVNSDRMAGARKAVCEYDSQVLILDDGFQHRQIQRDLDIVAIDATCPFGYGRMLPAGLLREPINSLQRANAVIITRFDQLADGFSSELEKTIHQSNPNLIIAKAVHKANSIKLLDGSEEPLESLKNKRIFAFCGIGNPGAFIAGFAERGDNLVGHKIYNDHHNYTRDDIKLVAELANRCKADMIITTQKDWVKIALHAKEFKNHRFAFVRIDLEFIEGEDEILELVRSKIKQ